MIKGNESDFGNIDFELQAKRCDKFLRFTLFLNFTELSISLQPDVWLRWGLDQNVALLMDKWLLLKNQNWILSTCDSFPLIVSHLSPSPSETFCHLQWHLWLSLFCQLNWWCRILSLAFTPPEQLLILTGKCKLSSTPWELSAYWLKWTWFHLFDQSGTLLKWWYPSE